MNQAREEGEHLIPPGALRPWQRDAAWRLTQAPYLLLGAQPGAGKTITTLTALADAPKRTLLVAPEVILDTVWSQEAARWQHTAHLRFAMAHTLSGHKREAAWFSKQGDLVTCTPDTLVRFLESVSKYERLPVARLVIDESQLFKNPAATRTQALLALSEHLPTWLLSGTPTPNGVLDAWAPGYLLSQGDAFWH